MKKRTCLMKKILVSVLSASLLLSGAPVSGSEFTDSEDSDFAAFQELPEEEFGDGEELFSADETTVEEEIHYIKGRPLTEEEREEQLAPIRELVPLDSVPQVESSLFSPRGYALYPSEYDARDRGIVTGAKNQHPFGICWAFGMASLLETSMLAQNKGYYDLSEEHLAYFFADRQNDPLGNTANDRNNHKTDYHVGGNDYLASVFLTTWSGMTTEMSVPLPTDAEHVLDLSRPLPPSKAYEASVYLKNAAFSGYSVDRMKQLLMDGDTVSFMYYMDTGYYNQDTGAYSCPVNMGSNHVSVVVGWNDHYSRKNFKPDSGVTSDGAWIVKNSWGTEWGEDGFFYVSYEDKTINSLVTAEAMTKPAYSNNYFYDGSSGMSTATVKTGQSVGNIFTASAGKGRMEILGEINVITYSDNSNYTVQVYTDIPRGGSPADGTPAYKNPVRFSQPLAGVQTVTVPEVTLMPGTRYSVVIRNEGMNTMKFCVEKDIDHGWMKCQADIRQGQGFWADSKGKWQDLYDSHATPRIKAHTRTAGKIPAPVLKASAKAYNQIQLTWNSISGADGYAVYRTEAGKKKNLRLFPRLRSLI